MRNPNADQVTEHTIELCLIRHGKTKGNLEKRYIGSTDEELLAEERERLAGLSYERPELLFVSGKKRAMETAKILFPEDKPVVIPELNEMDFGEFEGKNYLELQDDPVYQQYIDSNGETPFPKGESRGEFADRIERGFDILMQRTREQGKRRVCVVAHGGTFMAILWRKLRGDYFSYYVGNGECLRVNVTEGKNEETWDIT